MMQSIRYSLLAACWALLSCSGSTQPNSANMGATPTANATNANASSASTVVASANAVAAADSPSVKAANDSIVPANNGAAAAVILQPDHIPQHRVTSLMTVSKFNKKGRIVGEDVDEYQFKGEPKQKVSVSLQTSSKDLHFSVLRPDEQHLVTDQTNWQGELRGAGTYSIRVEQTNAAAKRGEMANYKLVFSVERKERQLPTREDVLEGRTHPEIQKKK